MGKKVDALKEAAETFADYAAQHMAKDPPQIHKARRNVEMARLCAKAGEFKIKALPKIPEDDTELMEIDGGSTLPALSLEDEARFADWKADFQSTQEASLTPAESEEPYPEHADTRALMFASHTTVPLKSLRLSGKDTYRLEVLVELGLARVDDVSDEISLSAAGLEKIGIRPEGVPDLPVQVQDVTGNIEERELAARYIDAKLAGVDKVRKEHPDQAEGLMRIGYVLNEIAHEFRSGMHLPNQVIEGRVIPYNEDRSTGMSHAMTLNAFFADVHARNVKAGWWTDIDTGEPLKRSVGEMFTLMVTELWEAYDAYLSREADDKLPEYPGLGVELGDLAIRLADFCGALAAGKIVENTYAANPGTVTFHEIGELAKKYEKIRKTPEAKGQSELGEFIAPMDVGVMIDAKLAYNARREDHRIENRLKPDGKKT